MDSSVEEIKNRLDIVDVIQGYIQLHKAGKDYKALCPFHSEKTPSFFVSPEKQIWHCFGGCNEGGDMFSFIMKIEGVEFVDALKSLAEKAGVVLKKQDPKIQSQRSGFYDILEDSCRFFEKQLKESSVGKKARDYLLGRGIDNASIEKFRVGYAPQTWRSLEEFLSNRGYEKDRVASVGLVIKKAEDRGGVGGYYDRFRGRIIFPIFDLNGRVIGFSGRIFSAVSQGEAEDKNTAKYINTPNTPVYDKSLVLYGLDKAKLAIRKADDCILVEGNTDVIMAHQAGTENVVATSGTSITPQHLKIVKRYTDNLTFCFDVDPAGENATKKGIDLALEMGFNIRVVILPEGKDPADYIAVNPSKWEREIKKAKSIIEFYFDSAFSKRDASDVSDKKKIASILLPVLKKIPNKIEQVHWLQKLSSRIGVDEKTLTQSMAEIKDKGITAASSEEKKTALKPREEMLEENLLCVFIKDPGSLIALYKKMDADFIKTPRLIPLFEKIMEKMEGGKAARIDFKKISGEEFNFLFLKAEHYLPSDIDYKKEAGNYIKELKQNRIRERLSQLSGQIKQAEYKKDKKTLLKLVKNFNNCSKELSGLDN